MIQMKAILSAGVMTVAAIATGYPAIAQPIPPKAADACTQRTAEEMVVATRDIEITGAGSVATNGTRTLFMRNRVTGQTAECRVNTIDGFVLSVTLTSQQPKPPQTVSPALINTCIQRTAEEMVVATRDIEFVQVDQPNPDGTTTVFLRNRVNGMTANCLVNPATNTVIRVTTTPATKPLPPAQGKPASPNDPIVRNCQAAVGRQIRASFANVQSVTFLSNTTQRFFISNTQEGIRGEGQFAQRSRMAHRFNYNCVVNIRNGSVQSANFNVIR